MHNSLLLNRVTPYGEKIYMTLSAYLEVGRVLYCTVLRCTGTVVYWYCDGTVLYCTEVYWY